MKSYLMQYILDTYGVEPDHPFATAPETEVFRNPRNQKWFGIVLGRLSKRCLGLNDDGWADVLNLKCDPIMTHALIDHEKIFPAYHMNKEHWISVLLDSSVTMDELSFLVDMSYRLVDKRGNAKAGKKE